VFLYTFLSSFVLTPFFITDASKVPIEKTFTYLFSDREAKLKETIFYGDIYKVYFYAKEKLPRGVVINSVSEIYTYDDHFKIRRNSENLEYIIMQKCGEDFYSLYEGGQFSLCKRR
jgi:hypothetical protein